MAVTVSDLHPALVRAFLERVRRPVHGHTSDTDDTDGLDDADDTDDIETLQRCGVLTRGSPPVPTRFGLLALGIRPERFLDARPAAPSAEGTHGAHVLLPVFDDVSEVTSRELAERTGLALGTIRRHLSTLLDRGLLEATASSTSRRRAYRRVHDAA